MKASFILLFIIIVYIFKYIINLFAQTAMRWFSTLNLFSQHILVGMKR
jgi:hypothetical protein